MRDGSLRPQATRSHRAAEGPLHALRAPYPEIPRTRGGRDTKAAATRAVLRALPSRHGSTSWHSRRILSGTQAH